MYGLGRTQSHVVMTPDWCKPHFKTSYSEVWYFHYYKFYKTTDAFNVGDGVSNY